MTSTTGEGAQRSESAARERLDLLLSEITPWDEMEAAHLREARRWVASGAPLYRVRPPDEPPMHLVSYFAVYDETRKELLLAGHRKSGLWLPTGGHCEDGEDPWETVSRECPEELFIDAVPSPVSGRDPLFITVTATRGPASHTDVSLWHVLRASADAVTSYDPGEFTGLRWAAPDAILAEPIDMLDPHMHRFAAKLLHSIQNARKG